LAVRKTQNKRVLGKRGKIWKESAGKRIPSRFSFFMHDVLEMENDMGMVRKEK